MASRRFAWLLPVGALAVVAAFYVFPFARPLHLESDSVCYLHAAELIAEGRGAGCPGCDRTHCSITYPPGYPWAVSCLIRAGVATPRVLVLLNVCSLLLALGASSGIWRRVFALERATRIALAALVGLSLPIFRYVVNPLSDFVFLGLASWSVYLMVIATSQTRWRRVGTLVLASLLAFGAFKVRTVGITLVPALVWAAGSSNFAALWRQVVRDRTRIIALVGVCVTALAGLAIVASRSEYVTVDLRIQYSRGIAPVLIRVLGSHLTELGELAVNLPAGKLPLKVRPALQILGAGVLALLAASLWRRRGSASPAEVFILATSGVVLVWPFEDTRFWIPVIPLSFGLLASAVRPVIADARRSLMVVLPVTIFVVFGLAGQVYSARLSLAGDDFPNRFIDSYLGPVYREAWGIPSTTNQPPDPTALHVLRRFEARARRVKPSS
jgi:hypothetical protein